MDLMEQLMESLGKLPDGTTDETKNLIKGLFQKVNVEAGKAKTDLETFKKGDTEYKKLTKKFKDAGIDESQFDNLAEELGVKKTLQDEVMIYKAKMAEDAKAIKEKDKALMTMKMESVLGKKVDEQKSAYTTPEGKQVKISEKFIDKTELYKQLDLESEVMVQDRIQKVMKTAYENQSAFMKELGVNFEGQPVHTVPTGESKFGSGKALDTASVKAVLDKRNGSLEAAAQALTLYENAAKAA